MLLAWLAREAERREASVICRERENEEREM